MNQVWPKTRDSRCLQRPSMAMPAVRLLKHSHGFHRFVRKKFPPTGKEQLRVISFISDLGYRAASRTDIAVVSVQDKDPAKSKMQHVSKYIRKIHRHHFGTNADRPTEVSRVSRALREA